MRPTTLLTRLDRSAREYGRGAERAKLMLLEALGVTRLSTPELVRVRDHLNFLRAYPDSARLLRAVETAQRELRARMTGRPARSHAQRGLPGSHNAHAFAHGMARWLVESRRHAPDIDWADWGDESPLNELLSLVAPGVESQGVEDITLSLEEWFARVRRGKSGDLELVLRFLDTVPGPPPLRSHLFDACGIPIRVSFAASGTAIGEVRIGRSRPHFHRRPLDRSRPRFADAIRNTPVRVRRGSLAEGKLWIDAARRELTARNLEIYPMTYAHAADVQVAEAAHGVRVYLFGVEPAYRAPLECLYAFLVAKNSVPVAYGPASAFLGQSEMGINLFPEFRGGEIGRYYGALGATLRRVLAVDTFLLTRYGMGEGNEDALRTGAFWFYRKLGFRPTNPVVEELARREEARMARHPAHRSNRAILLRLAETEAFANLSGENRRPLPIGAVGTAVSRWLEARFAGDRGRALRRSRSRIGRHLGLEVGHSLSPNTRAAIDRVAPLLLLLAERGDLPPAEWRRMAAFLRAKGARSEVRAARISRQLARTGQALRQLALPSTSFPT